MSFLARSLLVILAAFATGSLPGALSAATDYQLGPDSQPQPGVPAGALTKHTWKSTLFADTVRDYWVYLPAQLDRTRPACLLVVQDGGRRIGPASDARYTVVLDNLIHQKAIPALVAVFIDPGVFPAAEGRPARPNRSFEYDTLSDRYARFLLEEILPEVARTHGVVFTTDPAGRALSGQSSGSTAAFTAAWERPDSFRKILSFIGSYTGIAYRPAHDGQPLQPGGDLYPTLIRKNPIKPLKIFLQDGSDDLNNAHGNWFLANQQMLSALEWANANADLAKTPGPRYEVRHIWGDGAHNGKHAGAILPDALRWLWSGYVPQP